MWFENEAEYVANLWGRPQLSGGELLKAVQPCAIKGSLAMVHCFRSISPLNEPRQNNPRP